MLACFGVTFYSLKLYVCFVVAICELVTVHDVELYMAYVNCLQHLEIFSEL